MPDLQHLTQLRTQRLAFLHPSQNDLHELYPFFADPAQTYFLFLPPVTPQQQQEFWVNWNYGHWGKYHFGICAIRSQANGALLGMCGVTHQYINGRQYYEMLCFILPAHQNQGFATEALQTLGDFLTHSSRHSHFNNQVSVQTTSWSSSWAVSITEVEPTEDFIVVVPDRHQAARKVASKLGLIPLFHIQRGNEPATVARYPRLPALEPEAVNTTQQTRGILYALLMFFLIIPAMSAIERVLIDYFIEEQVPFFAITFANILCLILSGKIINFFSGAGSILKFIFSSRARQRPDETVFRQFYFWSWLAIPVCVLVGFAGGLIYGVWDAGVFSFAAIGLISGLAFMIAFRLGWFDDFI
ncbi:MAG: GNAT family N-acetyltransferase [Bacteroidia bacterium]|jgi:hypothetical protein|nr:GNAT family N-acetyltransferase [Bacteroidia bacterium]